MRVYDASTRISAEFGGIRDSSRHLSLNLSLSNVIRVTPHAPVAPELVHVLSEDVARPQRRDEVVELSLLPVHVALQQGGNSTD